jgi:hypothetical protein
LEPTVRIVRSLFWILFSFSPLSETYSGAVLRIFKEEDNQNHVGVISLTFHSPNFDTSLSGSSQLMDFNCEPIQGGTLSFAVLGFKYGKKKILIIFDKDPACNQFANSSQHVGKIQIQPEKPIPHCVLLNADDFPILASEWQALLKIKATGERKIDYCNGIVVLKLNGKPVAWKKNQKFNTKSVAYKGGLRVICTRTAVEDKTQSLTIWGVYNELDESEKIVYFQTLESLRLISERTKEPKESGYRYGMPCDPKFDDNKKRPSWWDVTYLHNQQHPPVLVQ